MVNKRITPIMVLDDWEKDIDGDDDHMDYFNKYMLQPVNGVTDKFSIAERAGDLLIKMFGIELERIEPFSLYGHFLYSIIDASLEIRNKDN